MKFTDGYWLMRPGVRAHYAEEVHEAFCDGRSLDLLVPTRPIRHRGDTLQGPVLTVRLSAPLDGVIRVQAWHYQGARDAGPRFQLTTSDGDVAAECGADTAELRSGALIARVQRQPWRLAFAGGGRTLTESGWRALGYVETDTDGPFMHDQLALDVGELVYGMGERFTAFVKNGQTVDIWNRDGGTGSEQAYKNVPFYLTNRGYGVFVNDPGPVSFEVASEKVSRVQFSVPGEALDYCVVYGPTPREVLERYTALTGRPALPPAWSFGLWLTTSFTTDYDEETVTSFVEGMAQRDLPLHVFHFDCFWMRGFRWCDLAWDPGVFPDPPAMLRRLKERGLRICVWINPYIAQRSDLFLEAARQGYLVRKPNGDIWQWDLWQPGMGIVDFTNPSARLWFADKLKELLAVGVDCFKTDFGERIPTDVAWHDGSDPMRMHNYYAHLYNQVVFGVLEESRGKGDAVLFARSATAGTQQYPVHWGGDCYSSFPSMAESLRGGLSLGLSGFGFWSHDIGGFEGSPPPDVYKRWIAFGLLSSHSRLHGSSSYRVPWLVDDEAVGVLRTFTRLKCRLMPYLYRQACLAHERGWPVMRAMHVEFPDDPACDTLDRQYMLGDSLLVAPVMASDGAVDYYVPAGRWTSLITGEVVTGPCWRSEQHGFDSLPLLVRPNSLLATGAVDDRPDYDYADGVTVTAYELADGAHVTAVVPDLAGGDALTVTVGRSAGDVIARADGDARSWRLVLAGVAAAATVTGADTTPVDRGVEVRPQAGATTVRVRLQE